MKDLDLLRCSLGIEVARSPKGLSLSQRKYLTDLLKNWDIRSKATDTPMDPNIHFDQNVGKSLADPEKYRRLIGKLIYLTVTQLGTAFVVGVLNRYIESLHQLYLTVSCRILWYLKEAPSKQLYYCPSSNLDMLIGLVILLIVVLPLVITLLLEAIW